MIRTRIFGALVGGLLIVALVPGTAWAPKVFHRTRRGGSCIAGFGAGTFAGELQLTHFTVTNGSLEAVGVVTGICTDEKYWVDVGPQTLTYPVLQPTVSCDEFSFKFGGDVTFTPAVLSLDVETVAIQAVREENDRLCVVARHYGAGRLDQVARLLNGLI